MGWSEVGLGGNCMRVAAGAACVDGVLLDQGKIGG